MSLTGAVRAAVTRFDPYPGADLIFDPYGTKGAAHFQKYGRVWPTLEAAIRAGAFDFARNSEAILPRPGGLTLFGANQPRWAPGYGCLIEQGTTNLAVRWDELDNASWSKSNVTVAANAGRDGLGGVSLDRIVPDNGLALSGASTFLQLAKAGVATAYSYSVTARAEALNGVNIFLHDQASVANAGRFRFNLANGSVIASATAIGTFTAASATAVQRADGLWRVTLTVTTSTETLIRARIYTDDSVITTGDGVKGILAGHVQLEALGFATSEVASGASAGVRLADALSAPYSIPGSGDFTLAGEVQFTRAADVEGFAFEATDGTSSNRLGIFKVASGVFRGAVTVAGVSTSITGVIRSGARVVKFALSRSGTTYQLVIDGTAYGNPTVAGLPTLSSIAIGTSRAGSSPLNDPIRALVAWPYALPVAEMQRMTA